MNAKRYNELWKMIKRGKATIKGKVSEKLSDIKAIDYEFRISGPSCGNASSCQVCNNKNVCWN